jgi:hypothetical protein
MCKGVKYSIYDKTIRYEKMPRIIETIHIGTTVLFLYPNPNFLKLPSLSYIIEGFVK